MRIKWLRTTDLAVGPGQVPAGKNGQKPTLLMSLTRKMKPKKIFHCRLEDLPSLLRV